MFAPLRARDGVLLRGMQPPSGLQGVEAVGLHMQVGMLGGSRGCWPLRMVPCCLAVPSRSCANAGLGRRAARVGCSFVAGSVGLGGLRISAPPSHEDRGCLCGPDALFWSCCGACGLSLSILGVSALAVVLQEALQFGRVFL